MTVDSLYLHFCKFNRAYVLGQTQVYVGAFRDRLFPVVGNIEAEAEKATQKAWEEIGSRQGYEEGPDFGDMAEQAQDIGIQVYEDLDFIRSQLIGLGIAGLFHLWERFLKEFLSRELRGNAQEIQKLNFLGIVEKLGELGWNLESEPYYSELEDLSLFSNTVKHGDGPSFKKLLEKRPDFFWPEAMKFEMPKAGTRAENLRVEPAQFDLFSNAVFAFWKCFPEQLNNEGKE
ncbi:MAG: hypothetical protein IID51_07750 [Proteobacteria bacterium]|nr:hypothetical protein [Pseudomonadota bacterium]